MVDWKELAIRLVALTTREQNNPVTRAQSLTYRTQMR
jgi:hypothetical protein